MVVNLRSEDGIGEVAGATVASAINGARNKSYGSWLYNLTLKGPMPDRVLYSPTVSSTPDGDKADAFLLGRYTLPGGHVRMTSGTPWDATPPNKQWAEELHGFGFLWHFNARASEDTSRHARWLVKTWLEKHQKCEGTPWLPHIIARRLISWYTNWPLICENADVIWRSTLLLSMARQARHLRRTAKSAPDGLPRFQAAMGVALTGICLPDQSKSLDKGLILLERELSLQVLADGGHVSRSPEALLTVFCDLLMLRESLQAGGHQLPSRIQHIIDRMGPAVEFFCHGDGKLALFNGGTMGQEGMLAKALGSDLVTGSPISNLPYSCYHRLSAKKTLVMVDVGRPPIAALSTEAHAGCLSFEMSAGKHRIITNCGTISLQGPLWHQAMRATPAHTTLSFDSSSSAEFIENGWAKSLLGARISGGPKEVECVRHEKDMGIWLEASHDGYLENTGLLHERRLFLTALGNDFRGEDRLIARPGHDTQEVAETASVRFHLHPDVRASIARDGSNVLLLLPNRSGWQFRAKGGHIALQESVFIGDGETIRRTNQIVVTIDRPRHDAQVNWAFRRLDGDKS